MYTLIIRVRHGDKNGTNFITDCRPPQEAAEALRSAQMALDEALNVQIVDLETSGSIALDELGKAANANGI